MGKRKIISEEDFGNIVLPVANDVLGIAIQMLSNDRIRAKCQDGHIRLCRIRGKMKRRFWIRQSDIVLVSPWGFQSDKPGDIYWAEETKLNC
ncbi:MAG: translation initiation factor 1A [Candidatus Bathyarchaeota archaeon]|nr:translation initiation factor 1A [Candidatus Bathyarchaeota archaeon]MDH5494993.1 translation initiation factor 1A [Candidatus Bathyarchaeota archaeon]